MRHRTAWLVAIMCLGLLGCSRQARVERYVREAETAARGGDYERAEINYLNAIRLDRSNTPAMRGLGLISQEQGRLAQAFVLLSRVQRAAPGDFEVDLRLAQCLLAGGGVPQAREQAAGLIGRQPTNEGALLLLAESSVTTNQLQDAQRRLGAVAAVAGGTAGYQVAVGLTHLRLRQADAAEAAFHRALAFDPKHSGAHVALGNLHLYRRAVDQAAAEFQRAAESAPARSPYRLFYPDLKLREGDLPAARAALEKTVKEAPDYLPAKTRLAQVAFAGRQWEECRSLLRDVLARDPKHLEALLWLARLYSAQSQPEPARKILEAVRQEYPNVPQAHYEAAMLELKLDPVSAAAVASLGRALALQPNYPEAVLALAEVNLRRGEAGRAVQSLMELIANRPDVPGAYFMLAAAQQAAGNFPEALKAYEDLGKRYPRNPQIPYRIGALQARLGKNGDARHSFAAALAIAPQYAPAIEQLVNLDLLEGRLVDARERAEYAVGGDPQSAAAHLLLARVHLAATNLAAAEKSLLRAVELAPESATAQGQLARVYNASGRQAQALDGLKKVVARQTNNLGAWMQIALLQTAASNHTAAAAAYERVLAVNPQFGPALNNLAWLHLEHLGNPQLAGDFAARARQATPEDPSVADTLAWVSFRARDYPRARALIAEAAEKLPQNPEVLFHKGMIHYQLAEEDEARAALRAALAGGASEPWRAEAELRLRVLNMDAASIARQTGHELEELLTRNPDDPILQMRLAMAWEREGQWQKCADACEKLLAANASSVPLLVKLGRLYVTRLDRPDRALALIREARKLDAENPAVQHATAKVTLQTARSAADYQAAYDTLRGLAARPSPAPEVIFDFALASLAIAHAEQAVEAMKRVSEAGSDPALAAGAEQFNRLLGALGRPALAAAQQAEAQRVLQSNAWHLPALLVTAEKLEQEQQHQSAADSYERILQRFPLYTPVFKALAKLYLTPLGQPAKAYDFAVRARDALPGDQEVARTLGILEYDRKAFSRAAHLLAETALVNPDDAEVQYRLGLALCQIKQPKEGKEALNKALRLAPNSSLAVEARRMLAQPQ